MLLDGSGSINQGNFNIMKQFASDLVGDLSVSPSYPQIQTRNLSEWHVYISQMQVTMKLSSMNFI